jgi:EmrB/QacA subfamily drug resistance transporter
MLAMGTVALEGTVVTAAMPSVVGELQGLTLYPWVFSVYLLASTTTVPIYGKLADVYGRRPVFCFGLSVFLLGTVLCGLSGSMLQLVAFRAVQGLGAGAVLPLTLTVLSDIYTLPERARVQPLTASVWGVFSLIGPSAGAFITTAISWRWIFWLNVPLCLLALALIWAFLRERVQRREVAVDYAGAATLTLGLIVLLLAVLEGGHAFAWDSWQVLALLGVAAGLFLAFALVERRAPDPVLPFSAMRLRAVAVSNAGNLLLGVCMFGLTSYVPLYAQAVQGQPPLGASAVLTPMQLCWSVAALLSGRLYVRAGFYRTALLGTGLIALGIAPLVLLSPDTPLVLASIGMGIAGVGFGNASVAFLLSPQSAVPWNLRGAVTSSTQFARTIGGSVGVALLGAILNARLSAAALDAAGAAGIDSQDVNDLVSAMLNQTARAALPPDAVAALSLAMADALHWIYLALFALAALSLAQVALFGRSRPRPMGAQGVQLKAEQPADTTATTATIPSASSPMVSNTSRRVELDGVR